MAIVQKPASTTLQWLENEEGYQIRKIQWRIQIGTC
jgi:hypothetical protein